MEIAAVNARTAAGAEPSNALSGESFMTLLIAQLKAQNPLSPMDPTQFVNQLVQFNSLDQLIQIKAAVQTLQNPNK